MLLCNFTIAVTELFCVLNIVWTLIAKLLKVHKHDWCSLDELDENTMKCLLNQLVHPHGPKMYFHTCLCWYVAMQKSF